VWPGVGGPNRRQRVSTGICGTINQEHRMRKTYQGSCHCGAVRFEADIDLSQGTLRCNCTLCSKGRFWPALVAPEAFRLLAGEAELSVYRCNTYAEQHPFCKHCGVRAFGIGNSPRRGVFYAVNLGCLDDVGVDELVGAPITYVDGRNDVWDTAPAEVRHL
jgi:hypothetical protein